MGTNGFCTARHPGSQLRERAVDLAGRASERHLSRGFYKGSVALNIVTWSFALRLLCDITQHKKDRFILSKLHYSHIYPLLIHKIYMLAWQPCDIVFARACMKASQRSPLQGNSNRTCVICCRRNVTYLVPRLRNFPAPRSSVVTALHECCDNASSGWAGRYIIQVVFSSH